MRFIIADADFLPEMAADIRYTPTFAFYQRGTRVRAVQQAPTCCVVERERDAG